MSDERGGFGAAADGDETDDTVESGGPTAVDTKAAARPQRPTGKRSRQRTADDGDGAAPAAEESGSEDGADDETTRLKKGKKSTDPGANPFVYVYNYLKQVLAELRKVIWPNRKQMVTYTSVCWCF